MGFCQTDVITVTHELSASLMRTDKEQHLDNDISNASSTNSRSHIHYTYTKTKVRHPVVKKNEKHAIVKKPQQSERNSNGFNDPIQLHNRYCRLTEAGYIPLRVEQLIYKTIPLLMGLIPVHQNRNCAWTT